MRRAFSLMLAVVATLGIFCTRENERYCRATSDCPPNDYCDTATDQCEVGSGDMTQVVDMAGRVDHTDSPQNGDLLGALDGGRD